MSIKDRITALFSLPKIYNENTGEWEKNDGHHGHSGLKKAQADVTAAGVDLMTVTTGKEAYITALVLYNSNVAAQTFELLENTSTRAMLVELAAGETAYITGDEIPLLPLDAGDCKGVAGTGNHIHTTIVYYEKDKL
jgi:hypothetical protein